MSETFQKVVYEVKQIVSVVEALNKLPISLANVLVPVIEVLVKGGQGFVEGPKDAKPVSDADTPNTALAPRVAIKKARKIKAPKKAVKAVGEDYGVTKDGAPKKKPGRKPSA